MLLLGFWGFVAYLLIPKGMIEAVIVFGLLLYLEAWFTFKIITFQENGLSVKYPLRLFDRRKEIAYPMVKEIRPINGGHLEGMLLKILYQTANGDSKHLVPFPGAEKWGQIKEVLKDNEVYYPTD